MARSLSFAPGEARWRGTGATRTKLRWLTRAVNVNVGASEEMPIHSVPRPVNGTCVHLQPNRNDSQLPWNSPPEWNTAVAFGRVATVTEGS